MSLLDRTRFVERFQFFDGQRLFADDLQGLEAFHRELRQLHNASLHQPGIGSGFAVAGEPGDREVTIGPGYALDLEGHEIVLTHEQIEPIPPVEGDPDGTSAVYDLTVSYPDDEDLEVAETRAGVCLPRGAVRLREEPVFCWVRLLDDGSGELQPEDDRLRADIAVGRKLILARAEVFQCQLVSLSIAERRNARPPTQPFIACGRSSPAWAISAIPPVQPGHEFSQQTLLLEGVVSTRTAGFVNTPCYTARIVGPRQLTGLLDGTSVEFFAEGLLSVHDPTAEQFRARILVVALGLSVVQLENPGAVFSQWTIEWMGVD